MEFPRSVYRCPGQHARQGGTFDSLVVKDSTERLNAHKAGWFDTLPEAIQGKRAEAPAGSVTADALAHREQLESRANELGVKFDGRTSDKKLAELIAKAEAPAGE